MKKKKQGLFFGVLVIVLAGGALLTGTFAYFTARRTVAQSRFAAGTLDLNVESGGQTLQPIAIDNVGATADMSGKKTWLVKNTGTLPGRLMLQLQNVTNAENGCNDQEKQAEPDCEKDTVGDLGKAIRLGISLNGSEKVSSSLSPEESGKIGADWAALTPVILQPGDQATIDANWSASENDYGNEVQSDSVSFDMDFRLVQPQ